MLHAETVDAAPAFQSVSTTALVAACLTGDQNAWSALIDRYKRLIYSIPVKQGMSADDAADIFQSVCLDLVAELGRVREPEALPQWLIQTTIRKCQRHRQRTQRAVTGQLSDDVVDA